MDTRGLDRTAPDGPVRYAGIFAALSICFAITLFTNSVVLKAARALFHRGADWPHPRAMVATTGDVTSQYLLASAKDGAFFFCLLGLAFLLRRSVTALWPELKRPMLWREILIAFAIASIFLFMLQPAGMGRFYSEMSVDPFLAEPSIFYRRILMPVLAHDLHLSGALYGVFFWIVFAITCALASLYLERGGVVLSRLERVSLYTTGMFGFSLGSPGYGEILVLAFTLLAMISFEREGRAGIVQTICFGLALLAHESAAILAFGVLGACRFGPRFLIHFAALLVIYALLFWASYGFDARAAAATQMVGNAEVAARLARRPALIALAVPAAWKLGLIAGILAAARSIAAREYRVAAIVVMGLAGAAALCAVATDYVRMIAFGTFALLVALRSILPGLTPRQRSWFAAINLLLPTVYVSTRGVYSYLGLYGLLLRPVLHG